MVKDSFIMLQSLHTEPIHVQLSSKLEIQQPKMMETWASSFLGRRPFLWFQGIPWPPFQWSHCLGGTSQEHAIVVSTYLSDEGLEVGVVEVSWQDSNFKFFDVGYFKGTLVGTPPDELLKFSFLIKPINNLVISTYG